MLSAIDGRSVPNDFAFTGTILPDGTIGAVGGVVEKIHAVKRAGRQRVVLPQFLRIETDLNTRASVDVVRLCESLGIERVPVSTIDEAYGRIHRLDIAPAPVEDHVQFSVARFLEICCYKRQKTYLAKVTHNTRGPLSSQKERTGSNQILFSLTLAKPVSRLVLLNEQGISSSPEVMRRFGEMV